MKKFLFIFIVLCFAFIASFPLLHSGLPPTHDGEYHVIRFYEFDKTLRAGDWYPRWAADLNNGYGVPLFNYVYPLPNYVASFLHMFGVSFIDGLKLNMFLATIIGSICMYLWVKIFWGEMGGIVSSVFYTFAPYHFVDIYVRGSVGEVWALAFFPAFLWCVTEFFKERKDRYKILSGMFLALIVFSHNILALMFFLFILSYMGLFVCMGKNKKYLILNCLYVILLGLGLSSIFWIPAIFEMKYVTGLQIYDIENNFPQLYQLLIPSWGSGFSNGNLQNQMSPQIGIANIVVLLGSLITLYIFLKRRQKDNLHITLFFFIWSIAVLLLITPNSLLIWEHIPFMNYIQFPWRFLSLEILFLGFLAGSMVAIWKNKIYIIIIIFLPIAFGIGYASPPYYFNRNDMYYISRSNFIDGTNSPGNSFNTIWFDRNLKKQKEKITITNGQIITALIRPTLYQYAISSTSGSQVTVNTAYFPGWNVFIDTKMVNISAKNRGLIAFNVPSGYHKITVQFRNTLIQMFATILSFISILFVFIKSALEFQWSRFLRKYE